MENADSRSEISIHRYRNRSACDVIVAIGDREMVVRLPDYGQAIKWAQMEARSYKLSAMFSEQQHRLRARENNG
jgi:hypothetical protein